MAPKLQCAARNFESRGERGKHRRRKRAEQGCINRSIIDRKSEVEDTEVTCRLYHLTGVRRFQNMRLVTGTPYCQPAQVSEMVKKHTQTLSVISDGVLYFVGGDLGWLEAASLTTQCSICRS